MQDEALWAVARESRWIDLMLFDQLVRYADGDGDFRTKNWQDVTRTWSPTASIPDPGSISGENRAAAGLLRQIFDVYGPLQAEADQLEADAIKSSVSAYDFAFDTDDAIS